MPHIARMIRAARWIASPEERASGELPADPLGDLVTKENVLSVFLVEDKSAQLDSVMAALAATRHRPANAHCVLLDIQHFDKLALSQETTEGDTPDPEVNRLHRNLTDLTATALVRLGELFFRHGGIEMRLRKQIEKQIVDGIRSGAIERGRLNRKIREHLGDAI